ncbi:hypothetical protein JIN85_04895 [Luteolibacter pohnpeiensis]|uniref:Uncharacterized protein n=1 Tax=Luteolibacter pohnpeiensis TaxID=454153 RepID=A0A934VVF3_9BACT|nr:hypothetical protein [Luteolibacter pohnpeiensis]MBK1881738.1 hypothetical protein [Luteolibacter pohnpeiensis]
MSNQPIPGDLREFRCIHCNGNIRIPRNLPATTGPCPHCSGIITSPAPESQGDLPKTPSGSPAAEKPIAAAPVPAAEAPVTKPEPAPAKKEKDVVPAKVQASASQNPAKSKPILTMCLLLGGILILVLLLGAGIVYFANQLSSQPKRTTALPIPPPEDPVVEEDIYIQSGWKKDAYQVLNEFLKASTIEAKLPYILNPEEKRAEMEAFYGAGPISEDETPANSFTTYPLTDEDAHNGLFMMIYDQPPQFAMKEFFRPLATLEVQYGLEEADILLSTVAKLDNFAMDPVLVEALFKKTPQGLKLDWDVYAQTKYRTFRHFLDLPKPGESKIFRVLIAEDVPDKGRAVTGMRTYRVADPTGTLYASRIVTDSVRINVPVDSDVGRSLNVINWRGGNREMPITRTATLELAWSDQEPSQLEIKRFLCWEFLGLGGKIDPASQTGSGN